LRNRWYRLLHLKLLSPTQDGCRKDVQLGRSHSPTSTAIEPYTLPEMGDIR